MEHLIETNFFGSDKALASMFKAFAEFQQDMDFVNKDSKGYGYDYADYKSVVIVVRSGFKGKGLSYTHVSRVDENSNLLMGTRIVWSDGQEYAYIESMLPLKEVHVVGRDGKNKTNDLQALGAGLTYVKRYTLQTVAGLPTEDDDGKSANVAAPKMQKQPQKPKQQAFTLVMLNKGAERLEKRYFIEEKKKFYDAVLIANVIRDDLKTKGFTIESDVSNQISELCVQLAEKHNQSLEDKLDDEIPV